MILTDIVSLDIYYDGPARKVVALASVAGTFEACCAGGTRAVCEWFSASLRRLERRTFGDSEKVVITSAPAAA